MRKFLVLVVALVLFSSLGFCGLAKLNVWVRDKNCEIVDRAGHLHIYNCQGKQVFSQWFSNGHKEVDLAPGCYIVQAGVVYGNIYTDKAFVLLKCGDEACVNLILPNFSVSNPPALNMQPLALYYCPSAILPAFAWNAAKAGITAGEVMKVIEILAKAAGIDKKLMLDSLKSELRMFEENLKLMTPEAQKETMDFIQQVKKVIAKD